MFSEGFCCMFVFFISCRFYDLRSLYVNLCYVKQMGFGFLTNLTLILAVIFRFLGFLGF